MFSLATICIPKCKKEFTYTILEKFEILIIKIICKGLTLIMNKP